MKKLITAYTVLILLFNFLFFQIIIRWIEPDILPEQNIFYISTWIAIPICVCICRIIYKSIKD